MTTELSFSDFTMLGTSANAVQHLFIGHRRLGPLAGVEQDTPSLAAAMVGTGSLQLQYLSSGLEGQVSHSVGGAALSGWIRTLVNVQKTDDVGVGVYVCGCYCYASQADLRSGSGNVYLLGLTTQGGRHAHLVRSATGLQGFTITGGTVLASTGTDQWPLQTQFAIMLLWRQIGSTLRLQYWQGGGLADLTLVLTVDQASPLSGTVGQGLWGRTPTASSLNVLCDQTGYKVGL